MTDPKAGVVGLVGFEAEVRCLCKQLGIPEVDAVVAAVAPLAERHWRAAAERALAELEARLDELADDRPGPDVDALAAAGRDRDGLLEELIAALLLGLRTDLAAPFPPATRGALRGAARRLLASGAGGVGAGLDLALPRAAEALAAAEVDLAVLLRGRLEERTAEVEAALRRFLTDRTARLPAAAPSALVTAGVAPLVGREAWRANLRALLGLDDPAGWIRPVVDAWAYRWHNASAFIHAAAGAVARGEALVAVNNPPGGPDARTTPFCRWVHGRVLSVTRAASQVRAYTRAALEGDLDAMIRAWPLLSSSAAARGGPAAFRVSFAQLGLPPYHWGCRTRVALVGTALAPAVGSV